MCIGRQGCVIREMQQTTGTRIQIPSQPTPGQPHRVATVSGTLQGCNQVQTLIERIVTEQSSACVMSGTPYNSSNNNNNNNHNVQGQYHGQGGDGQNEYSAEWQAYYAAQAVAKQQGRQQQETQSSAPARAPAPSNGSQPTSDAYHEQFFRYAYYYGEDAARQYYGAWSPPAGTPNPYGVNPNGVSAAPAPAAGHSSAATSALTANHAHYQHVPARHQAQQQSNVRDSSVRKVSNLPAWMTRNA